VLLIIGLLIRNNGGAVTFGKFGLSISQLKENLTLKKQMACASQIAVIINNKQIDAVKNIMKLSPDAERYYITTKKLLIDEQLNIMRLFFEKNGFAEMTEKEYREAIAIQKTYMFEAARITWCIYGKVRRNIKRDI
jgi:hypothetical protein